MNAKALGVIAALKGRKPIGKKKSGLLGIAEKLTARRKAEKDGAGGPGFGRTWSPKKNKVPQILVKRKRLL